MDWAPQNKSIRCVEQLHFSEHFHRNALTWSCTPSSTGKSRANDLAKEKQAQPGHESRSITSSSWCFPSIQGVFLQLMAKSVVVVTCQSPALQPGRDLAPFTCRGSVYIWEPLQNELVVCSVMLQTGWCVFCKICDDRGAVCKGERSSCSSWRSAPESSCVSYGRSFRGLRDTQETAWLCTSSTVPPSFPFLHSLDIFFREVIFARPPMQHFPRFIIQVSRFSVLNISVML